MLEKCLMNVNLNQLHDCIDLVATTRKITQITIALKRISLSLSLMYKISAGRWFRARVATPHLSRAQTWFILLLLDPYCLLGARMLLRLHLHLRRQEKEGQERAHIQRDFLGVLHNIPP